MAIRPNTDHSPPAFHEAAGVAPPDKRSTHVHLRQHQLPMHTGPNNEWQPLSQSIEQVYHAMLLR